MNIYVAGKTHDIATVRQVQELAKGYGHVITHDWCAIVEKVGGPANEHGVSKEDQGAYAMADMNGVYTAELVIACGHPDLCGTLWECGAAVAFRKPLWLFRWEYVSRHSVFEYLPHVRLLTDVDDLNQRLWDLSPNRAAEKAAPPIFIPHD